MELAAVFKDHGTGMVQLSLAGELHHSARWRWPARQATAPLPSAILATDKALPSWLGWLDRLGPRQRAPSKLGSAGKREGQTWDIMGACYGCQKVPLTSADRRLGRCSFPSVAAPL
jgi:hypothetical protein